MGKDIIILDSKRVREYAKNTLQVWNEGAFNAEEEAIRDAVLCLALEKLGVNWQQVLASNKVNSLDMCEECDGFIGFECLCDEKLFSGVK